MGLIIVVNGIGASKRNNISIMIYNVFYLADNLCLEQQNSAGKFWQQVDENSLFRSVVSSCMDTAAVAGARTWLGDSCEVMVF